MFLFERFYGKLYYHAQWNDNEHSCIAVAKVSMPLEIFSYSYWSNKTFHSEYNWTFWLLYVKSASGSKWKPRRLVVKLLFAHEQKYDIYLPCFIAIGTKLLNWTHCRCTDMLLNVMCVCVSIQKYCQFICSNCIKNWHNPNMMYLKVHFLFVKVFANDFQCQYANM